LQILASEVISASYTEIQQIASELFLFFKDECQSGRKINCTVHTHSPMRGCSPWIFSTWGSGWEFPQAVKTITDQHSSYTFSHLHGSCRQGKTEKYLACSNSCHSPVDCEHAAGLVRSPEQRFKFLRAGSAVEQGTVAAVWLERPATPKCVERI